MDKKKETIRNKTKNERETTVRSSGIKKRSETIERVFQNDATNELLDF